MKKVIRFGTSLLLLALVFTTVAMMGCSSSPSSTPESTPEVSAVEANDSIVWCQIALYLAWDGSFPREMRVYVLESTDVAGFTNYTKDKLSQEIDVILDDNLDWLMLGQQITGHVQLRENSEGGTSFYINNITH